MTVPRARCREYDPNHLRVLVVLHNLRIGGSQRNAVDLSIGLKRRGHDVVVAGPPGGGVLIDALREGGVPFEPLENDEPGKAVARAIPGFRSLLALTRRVRPDLIHSYELTPSILTYLGAHRLDGVPMTMTINSMSVPDFMPGSVPLQVCNPVIAHRTAPRTGSVGVLEIPTDTVDQYPGRPGGAEFRAGLGIGDDELAVVVVSRFARALKQEGLETAIRAAGRLDPRRRARLVLVGDGPAMPDLRRLAAATNAAAGREVVLLTGELVDPRPAYTAADVALGMGGSLLRAMAFGKPCIVQGENGYFEVLDATTARKFRWHGFYGIGDGGTGEDRLVSLLDGLLGDAGARAEGGAFARELVTAHYSLDRAIDVQLAWYHRTLAETVIPRRRDVARTIAETTAWMAQRAVQRPGGRAGDDFFNSPERIAEGILAPIPAWFEPTSAPQATAVGAPAGLPAVSAPAR